MNDELEQLKNIQSILQDFFLDMPAIEINKGKHHYLTADWAFVLTFNDNGNFVLLFSDRINPLLSASIAQLLTEKDIKFELHNNYYYSPYTKELYFDTEDIAKAKISDEQKMILQSSTPKIRH